MISCGSIFKSLVLVYIVALGLHLYGVAFPSICPHAKILYEKSNINSYTYGRLLAKYQSKCLAPLLDNNEMYFDIDLYVGYKDSIKVWSKRAVALSDPFVDRISFDLPNKKSFIGDKVYGWFHFTTAITRDRGNQPIVVRVLLAEARPARRRVDIRNLLDSNTDVATIEDGPTTSTPEMPTALSNMVMHWKHFYIPVSIRYAAMYRTLDNNTMAALGLRLSTQPAKVKPTVTNALTEQLYNPIMWLDDMSVRLAHYVPFTLTNASSNITVSFSLDYGSTSFMYFWCKNQISTILTTLKELDILDDNILDEIKVWLSEDRLFMLLVTQIVGWLHITFEYLAFRDDYRFFKGRKTYKGISASSLLFGFGRSVVLFLYLHDSGTSWIVLLGILKDILYDAWKLYKVLRPSLLRSTNPYCPFTIVLRDLSTTGDNGEKETAKYDHSAMVHGGLILYPAVIGLGIYYLKTYAYKSWYSWCVSSLVDSIYAFGFLSLVPQIYINYKLKSVAHLPIRSFMYKIFNTFIDDVFAFVVQMPLKHKIMTLRDDAIFLVFIYQWWIYPADMSRPNEFGFQYNEQDDRNVTKSSGEQQDTHRIEVQCEEATTSDSAVGYQFVAAEAGS